MEPGRQAFRLESLLSEGKTSGLILKDRFGNKIDLDISAPYVIHKFGICLEHFPGMTTSRRYFMDLHLLESKSHWAPILSLSELMMISTFLDTEISFFHYLTRRSSIDDLVTIVGDEQDLLSMYLINGFSIDVNRVDGREIVLANSDGVVRVKKRPREDRKILDTPGVFLPPMWRLIAKEIYASDNRHRFSILEVLLNQSPPSLIGMMKQMQSWKKGSGRGKNVIWISYSTRPRVFVLCAMLLKEYPRDDQDWRNRCRQVARELVDATGGTD